MVTRPTQLSAYEYVVVCALRAQQLLAGSTPRVEGDHSAPTMAQMEVAAGQIVRATPDDTNAPAQCGWQR